MADFEYHDVSTVPRYAGRMDISFSIDGFSYILMHQQEKNGGYVPTFIYHEFHETCPLCRESYEYGRCLYLDERIQTIFHQLIELPSIRLEWLFLTNGNEKG